MQPSRSEAILLSIIARRQICSRGFMLAPLLYMLALGGIGAAVMFSGYSQVLRSNAEMTAITTARQQLNAAGQTLSASSVLDVATSTILEPPAVAAFAGVTDGARLPLDYANVATSGTPHSVGVVDVTSGVRQLDPWGKYYVYCRWQNAVADPAAPALAVISAGPDGSVQTRCGDALPQGDDRSNRLTVAEAVNRANVWQINSSSQIKFGVAANAVKVNDDGTMEAASLSLGTPLALVYGGTGASNAAAARSNLSVPDLTGSGATGTWGISITGNAATATALQTSRNISITGTTGLSASAIAFDGTQAVPLTLSGTLALAHGGTGATTAAGARTNLGATTTGAALFTAATAAAARATLGATATGSALLTAVDAAAARTSLGLGTMATQNANAVVITGGTISGVSITSSAFTGTVNGDVTGTAGAVPAAGITGVVALTQGGTGVNASSNSNLRNLLGIDDATNLLIGTLPVARLPLIAPSSAGTYNWGTVDTYGRVTHALNVTSAAAGTTGAVQFNSGGVLAANATFVWDNVEQRLGIGTATPKGQVHLVTSGEPAFIIHSDVEFGLLPSQDFEIANVDAGGVTVSKLLDLTNQLITLHGTSFAVAWDNNVVGKADMMLRLNGEDFEIVEEEDTIALPQSTQGGHTWMHLADGGNIGLGTTAPSVRLHLHGVGGNGGAALFESASWNSVKIKGVDGAGVQDSAFIAFEDQAADSTFIGITGTAGKGAGGIGDLRIGLNGERLRISKASGYIGIGTTLPRSALHVADGTYLQIEDNNAGAPPAADCDADAERGRISIDTASNRLYVCNGATRGWDFMALSD